MQQLLYKKLQLKLHKIIMLNLDFSIWFLLYFIPFIFKIGFYKKIVNDRQMIDICDKTKVSYADLHMTLYESHEI